MLTLPASGRCQCQSCAYTLRAQPFVAYTCHCRECQRLTGSAFASCIQVPAEAVITVSGKPQRRDRVAESGNTLSTLFCPSCGTALFSQNAARPLIRTVYVGTLDKPEDAAVGAHIWTKRKLPWVVIPPGYRVYPEAGDWSQDYAHAMQRYRPDEA